MKIHRSARYHGGIHCNIDEKAIGVLVRIFLSYFLSFVLSFFLDLFDHFVE